MWSELIGTAIYIYIRLTTTNPLIIGASLAILLSLVDSKLAGSFNPGLDLAQYLVGVNPWSKFLKHIFTQILGVIVAALLYNIL